MRLLSTWMFRAICDSFYISFFRVSILVFAFLLTTFAQRDNMAWFNETVFWMLDTRKNTLEIDNLCSKIRIDMAALNRFAANLRQMRDYLRNCVCYCNKQQSLSVYSICIGHCQFLSVFIFSLHTIAFGVHKTTSTFITYQCRRCVFFFLKSDLFVIRFGRDQNKFLLIQWLLLMIIKLRASVARFASTIIHSTRLVCARASFSSQRTECLDKRWFLVSHFEIEMVFVLRARNLLDYHYFRRIKTSNHCLFGV